jgi:hypothetical protein
MFGSRSFSAASFSQSPTGPIGLKGLAATGGVGSVSVNGDADAVVAGLEATASNGVLVFNESVAATGLEATGSVGSVSISLPIGATLTGVSASMPMTSTAAGGSLLGGLAFAEEPLATLTDGDLQITIKLGAGASVTGLEATGTAGSVQVSGVANTDVTGLGATGSVGSVTVDAAGQAEVTGVAGTGTTGSVTVIQGSGANVAVSSPRLQGQVGVVAPNAEVKVFVTGVSGAGQTVGASVVSWNEIIPNQDPNWVEIAA